MQVPQDMTRTNINRRVSEAIGMPNGSYSLFYLDDLTSSYQSLSLPEDYTTLAYIALYKGLCLSVQLEQHQLWQLQWMALTITTISWSVVSYYSHLPSSFLYSSWCSNAVLIWYSLMILFLLLVLDYFLVLLFNIASPVYHSI